MFHVACNHKANQPLFLALSNVHSLVPDALCNPGLVDVVHRVCGEADSASPLEVSGHGTGLWDATQLPHALTGYPGQDDFTRMTPISPMTNAPYPISYSPAVV